MNISENHNVYTIDLIFMAEPDMLKDPILYIHGITILPDVNGDGVADAVDASAILSAYIIRANWKIWLYRCVQVANI